MLQNGQSHETSTSASDRIKNFFLFCSGAHLDILRQEDCKNEHNKYIGIGSAVFFTAVFAFLSASYALYTVFRDSAYERSSQSTDYKAVAIAVGFGLIWAGFIFSLDRYIVSTLKKENGRYTRHALLNGLINRAVEILKASPRIALAILLALVISKPLELKIFEKEISNELIAMQQSVILNQEQKVRERYAPSLQRRNEQINTFQGEIEEKKRFFDTQSAIATQEADGTGGSRRPNLGPIYRTKKAAADQAELEFKAVQTRNQPKIDTLRNEIGAIEGALKHELANMERVGYDGLLARITALGNLTEYQDENVFAYPGINPGDSLQRRDSTSQTAQLGPGIQQERPIYKSNAMYYANLAILLLFMCIELAPLIFKILTDKGNYDLKLQMHEDKVYAKEMEEISALHDETQKRMRIKTGENEHLVERELADNKTFIEKLSEARKELANEIIERWKKEQQAEIRKKPGQFTGGKQD